MMERQKDGPEEGNIWEGFLICGCYAYLDIQNKRCVPHHNLPIAPNYFRTCLSLSLKSFQGSD